MQLHKLGSCFLFKLAKYLNCKSQVASFCLSAAFVIYVAGWVFEAFEFNFDLNLMKNLLCVAAATSSLQSLEGVQWKLQKLLYANKEIASFSTAMAKPEFHLQQNAFMEFNIILLFLLLCIYFYFVNVFVCFSLVYG